MSTRAAIARLTGVSPVRWTGRYHHWDGYPSGLGATLWQLYHGHFKRDLDQMLRVLLDEHPAGWSSIHATDFDQQPGFAEPFSSATPPAERPNCYCHGDRAEAAWELTQENAAGSGCEWAYAFTRGSKPEYDAMLILSSYQPTGQKMIGYFGQGDPDSIWAVVAVIGLHGPEPDWEALNRASPLDPLFPSGEFERGAQTGVSVHRDKRPGIYVVREPNGAFHYVSRVKEDGETRFYCTCSPDEAAASPDCLHAQALHHFLDQHHRAAKERQGRGLHYIGGRTPYHEATVLVWESGQPALLAIQSSQKLFNHSAGFAWGYEGSGPAQLALAILLDFTGDEKLAMQHHQKFKREVIATIPQDELSWCIIDQEIESFLQTLSP